MKIEGRKIIDATKLSLDEWLELLNSDDKENVLFLNFMFPTDNMRNEYLDSIHIRTDQEVINLLRNFLITSGSLCADKFTFEWLMSCLKNDREQFDKLMKKEHLRHLFRGYITGDTIWEGNTWVIDLIPDYPKLALDVLHAYLYTFIGYLPDGRINGLEDAMAVIRAKFIETPRSSLLLSLDPYQFEHLIYALYKKMEYTTELTQRTHDKGRDVIAERKHAGEKERVLIECRRAERNIGVKEVRALLGVVSNEKATKGVFVSTSEFTPQAKKFEKENPRLELIGNRDLQLLLNRYFGSGWSRHIDAIISVYIPKRRTSKMK
jgi:Restriction endonuclease